MSNQKGHSLGQAIDLVVAALEPLDPLVRATVIRAACEHLEVALASAPVAQPYGAPGGAAMPPAQQPPAPQPPPTPQDIRSLRQSKQPKTAIEMACIVAYYLDALAPAGEQKATVTKADLEKYFKQAGQKLPKAIQQVLVDAKSAGYMDSPKRGQYKLNPVGHNLVVHTLPRTSE